MKKRNPLPGLALFQGVKPDTLEWLFKEGRTEHFPKGSIMIRAKEPLKSVYIQISGKSIVYNLTHTGKRKIIFIFGSGALLNEHVLNFHDSSLFCETIETSLVFILPAAKLWKLSRDFGKNTEHGLEIDINMTITFLADMLGAPRENTSRLCKTLTEFGLIRMKKKRIVIVNPEKLSHFYKTGEIGS